MVNLVGLPKTRKKKGKRPLDGDKLNKNSLRARQ